MREYESIFVLDPEVDEAGLDAEIQKIRDLVTTGEGEVMEVQKWGRRKLAYEIQKKTEGVYTLLRFKGSSEELNSLNRHYQLNESLLRHLTVLYEGPFPGELEGMAGHSEEAPRGRDYDDDDEDDDRRRRRPPVGAAPAAAAVVAAPVVAEAPAAPDTETPAEAPVETSAETPTETPAETPAEAPAAEAAESPAPETEVPSTEDDTTKE